MFVNLLLISSFLFSSLTIYFIKTYALKNCLDVPNQRSAHLKPTPRGGGVGIVCAFFLTVMAFWATGRLEGTSAPVLLFGLPVAAIGFRDDHRHVPAWTRLLVHLIAAAGALYFMPALPPLTLGGVRVNWQIVSAVLAVFYSVWMLNLFNFMDGIDGIAASEAVFVAGALGFFLNSADAGLARVAAALGLASLGFLLWNWPPAKIFMGDVGSGFLGFMLALLILLGAQKDLLFLSIGMILTAVFMVDASYTLLYRFVSGQAWHQAHSCHAYQQAARKYGHLKVIVSVWMINLLFLLPVALLIFRYPVLALPGVCAVYIPLLYLALKLGAGKVRADV
ncbi:MAG: glycosyl transferase [Gammaproteobacteria bacterium HGW-Gammaproteobacteria-3]|nr:MAG: glycosyl transferase [Gammaproteobacteria bacterium HGW-Gammaproteobacteria-3]